MAEKPHESLAESPQSDVHAPQCAICKEDYILDAPLSPTNLSNQDQTVVEIEECSHRFHKACFIKWARLEGGRNICPTCYKALFNTIQEKNVELDDAGQDMLHAVERVRDIAAWFLRNNVMLLKFQTTQREMMALAESGTGGWDAAWKEIDMADAEDEHTAAQDSPSSPSGQHVPLLVSQQDRFFWSDDENEAAATQGQVASPDAVQSPPLAQDHPSAPLQGHSSSTRPGPSFLPLATTPSTENSQGGTNGNAIG
ncbi:hypothetical protein K505DRAFT_367059 [Melanomma pulvis-pyrius CBS 109.77]|uniref:RING-type domain-containing protein n=1 Tax=Melanomma pulvis-pyrius CBS 109.77 TaxID=1314802 RepID=A0A6A6WV65_9PLEO|nr:hypothetical protein K505DRAFT_367059 [Melanomma pulvis-pyrius CBS 109.77]